MAAPTVRQMRDILKARYSPEFAKKVDKMDAPQVYAIYMRLVQKGNNK